MAKAFANLLCFLSTSEWRMWWSFSWQILSRFCLGKNRQRVCHQKSTASFTFKNSKFITENYFDRFHVTNERRNLRAILPSERARGDQLVTNLKPVFFWKIGRKLCHQDLRTPRPASEPRDGQTRTFHKKYRKNTPRAEILEHPQNTATRPKTGVFGILGYFLALSGYFGG